MAVRRVLSVLVPAAVLAAALGCTVGGSPTEPEPWLTLRWVRYTRPEPAVEICKEFERHMPGYRTDPVGSGNPRFRTLKFGVPELPPDRWRLGRRDVFWWDLDRQFAPNIWHKMAVLDLCFPNELVVSNRSEVHYVRFKFDVPPGWRLEWEIRNDGNDPMFGRIYVAFRIVKEEQQ